jgi:hypothetical protein
VALAPTNLTFSSQPVGTTSAAQTVTLTNIGKTVLEFTNASTTGDNPAGWQWCAIGRGNILAAEPELCQSDR